MSLLKRIKTSLWCVSALVCFVGVQACAEVPISAEESRSLHLFDKVYGAEDAVAHCSKRLAPRKLRDQKMVLAIEHVTSERNDIPRKGVFVTTYLAKRNFTREGYGDGFHEAVEGEFRYRRLTKNSAIERGLVPSTGERYTTKYFFSSPGKGRWRQVIGEHETVYEGRFALSSRGTNEEGQVAPASTVGLNVGLTIQHTESDLPDGVYPTAGIVVQTYQADGNYTAVGIGPGNVNSWGTYSYTRVSDDVAVEEAVQSTDFFTLPYTMTYIFDTQTTGTWFQNFGEGTILFSGSFSTFPN